jgi:hypothetical protein
MSKHRCCWLMAAAVLLLIISGCLNRPPKNRELMEPTADEFISSRLKQLVTTGRQEHLLALTHKLTVKEIAARLKAMPRSASGITPLAEGAGARLERVVGPTRDSIGVTGTVFDSRGAMHFVYYRSQTVKMTDYLGNKLRSVTKVIYRREEHGKWSDPAVLYRMGGGALNKLLMDRKGKLFLVGIKANNTPEDVDGIKPGHSRIVLLRKPRDGKWSKPEWCTTDPLKLEHGFDASLDDEGRLHLIWAHWRNNRERQALRYRVRGEKLWGKEEVLPRAEGRNLTNPLVRRLGGQLRVVAAAQTSDYGTIGTCQLVRQQKGWVPPQLILDKTGFEHRLAHRGSRFLLTVFKRASPMRGSYLFFGFDEKTARLKPAGRITLSGTEFDPSYGWSYLSVAWGPDRKPYALVTRGGNLYLLRPGAEGTTEALCVFAGKEAKSQVWGQHLFFRKGRVRVMWSAQEQEMNGLYVLDGVIPEKGWQPVDRLPLRLRAGVGLIRSDHFMLSTSIYHRARELEEALDMDAAVERYVYILRNTKEGTPSRAWERLGQLEEAGINAVRRYFWKQVKGEPNLGKSKDPRKWCLGHLLKRIVKVSPDDPKIETLLNVPAQDKDTIRKLLVKWSRAFTVPLAGGKEVYIIPDRRALGGHISLDSFIATAREKLKGKPAEQVGETVISTLRVRNAKGVCLPPAHFKLKDLASFTIRDRKGK